MTRSDLKQSLTATQMVDRLHIIINQVKNGFYRIHTFNTTPTSANDISIKIIIDIANTAKTMGGAVESKSGEWIFQKPDPKLDELKDLLEHIQNRGEISNAQIEDIPGGLQLTASGTFPSLAGYSTYEIGSTPKES